MRTAHLLHGGDARQGEREGRGGAPPRSPGQTSPTSLPLWAPTDPEDVLVPTPGLPCPPPSQGSGLLSLHSPALLPAGDAAALTA